MDQNRQQWRVPASTERTDQVLERYYGQLVAWGTLLTRGDEGKALDLVHDFCLNLTVTKPDLSGVRDMDGYLYKSLRHIYLSGLAQSSREALQFVNVAEFDSVQFALSPHLSSDRLQRQNDLRRICSYSVWRKAQTKSASYFILRYFHGYHHNEIAELARTNLAAIYSKFRRFRVEVRSFLEEPGKLQFTNREVPPTPKLRWTPLSSVDLFKELRKHILDARTGDCLTEEELIALYSAESLKPISCSLLSHIVSCERCLALVDNHLQRPTLKDREPLDEVSDISDSTNIQTSKSPAVSREKLFRSVRRHCTEVLEHRPRTLSIAVDGKILASHDVQGQRNVLSARIERPESASFVEVFSEQNIRLALLSVGELPPEGPHEQTQRVILSDERWLDLTLAFDGLGLHSEVVYFDPALAPDLVEEDDADASVRVVSRSQPHRIGDVDIRSWAGAPAWTTPIRRLLRHLTPTPVVAWALAIACVFGVAGYFVFRSENTVPVLTAHEVLSRSIQAEAASLSGQTEHQVFRFEEATADGTIVKQGSIDLWKDGDDKRSMRRLYDAQHRLIAAEWKQQSGDHGEYPADDDSRRSSTDDGRLLDNVWKQDISPVAFQNLRGDKTEIRRTEDGYELTTSEMESSHPQLVSATLVLDRHYHPIREVMRLRDGADVREVRFIQADYERRPSSSVPDAIFDPSDQGLHSRMDRRPILSRSLTNNAQLAELHIAALYQLNRLDADASEPIEVDQTSDGRIRVSGTVADDSRKQQILSQLSLLNDHQLLDLQIISAQDVIRAAKAQRATNGSISTYDLDETKAPANAILRGYFQSQGLTGEPLDAAVRAFSREALGHAQRALQNASALSRLGNAFPAADFRSISFSSQQQWTEMTAKHAAALEVELRNLQDQMARLSPSQSQQPGTNNMDALISDPPAFARATQQLLLKTKQLNQTVGSEFASGQSSDTPPTNIDSLVTMTSAAIPLEEAANVTSFAVQLNAAARTAEISRQHSRPDTRPPDQPQ